MKNSITIYAGKPIKKLFGDKPGNVSGRLNAVVDRYLLLCDSDLLDLAKHEKAILRITYSGLRRVTAKDIMNYKTLIYSSGGSQSLIDKIETGTLVQFIATLDALGF